VPLLFRNKYGLPVRFGRSRIGPGSVRLQIYSSKNPFEKTSQKQTKVLPHQRRVNNPDGRPEGRFGRSEFLVMFDLAGQNRLGQLAVWLQTPLTIPRDVGHGLGAGYSTERLVLPAAIAGPTAGIEIALIVAPTARFRDHMVEGDIGRGGPVQIPQAE